MPGALHQLVSSRFFWAVVAGVVILLLIPFLVFGLAGTGEMGVGPITTSP
jgi:hypothetical protein